MRAFAGALASIVFALGTAWPVPVLAWGDDGHVAIATIAQSLLRPGVRAKIAALLAADTDPLVPHDIASASTWADKYRDLNVNGARQATREWHFVDTELAAPDLALACFGHPRLPRGTPASSGPARACVVDKIEEFAVEVADPAVRIEERIVALKFLLHLIGDVHQPLHAADDHDRGGNDKRAVAAGMPAGTLHHYWDTEFVNLLGPNPKRIAAVLLQRISTRDVRAWSRGGPAEWAAESFRVAKDDVFGRLPSPDARGSYRLSAAYVATATRDVASQLSKAGVRLAWTLNRVLAD